MAKIDLKPLSLKDLHSLRARVDKAIERFENKKRNAALAALKAEAKKLGFSLDDLTGGAPKASRRPKKKPGAKKAAVVAYRDTEDKNNTWAGRGPRPKWLKDALGKGKKLEDFKV